MTRKRKNEEEVGQKELKILKKPIDSSDEDVDQMESDNQLDQDDEFEEIEDDQIDEEMEEQSPQVSVSMMGDLAVQTALDKINHMSDIQDNITMFHKQTSDAKDQCPSLTIVNLRSRMSQQVWDYIKADTKFHFDIETEIGRAHV